MIIFSNMSEVGPMLHANRHTYIHTQQWNIRMPRPQSVFFFNTWVAQFAQFSFFLISFFPICTIKFEEVYLLIQKNEGRGLEDDSRFQKKKSAKSSAVLKTHTIKMFPAKDEQAAIQTLALNMIFSSLGPFSLGLNSASMHQIEK